MRKKLIERLDFRCTPWSNPGVFFYLVILTFDAICAIIIRLSSFYGADGNIVFLK